MIDARRTFSSLAIGMVLAFSGSLLLRLIDAPAVWFYAFGIAVTTAALFQAVVPAARVVSLERWNGRRETAAWQLSSGGKLLIVAAGLIIGLLFCLMPQLVKLDINSPFSRDAETTRDHATPTTYPAPGSPQVHRRRVTEPGSSAHKRGSERTEDWEKGERVESELETAEGTHGRISPSAAAEPRPDRVRSPSEVESKNSTDAGSSSPLVPILIAIAALAAISTAVVMVRVRRQRHGRKRASRGFI